MGDILLVEDHAVYREPIKAVLEHAGHSVRAVSNGIAALGALADHMPDLIMLDLAMPGMGGEEVLRHVREFEKARGLPVIVVTGKADKESVKGMARLGVNAYLSKNDFSLDRLLALVTHALELKSQSVEGKKNTVRSRKCSAISRSLVGARVRETKECDHETATMAVAPNPIDAGLSALKKISPLLSRGGCLERLASAAELDGFSPAVREILALTSTPGCTIDAVAKAVSQDAAMSLRVIKLANSAAYARGLTVETVRRAVVQIGITRIQQTVQTLGIVEKFSGLAFEEHVDTTQFWEHSIACAIIAAEIARATDPASADSAFTCGLLHDVGRLILAKELGPLYVQVIETAHRLQLPMELVESRMLSVNHAEVMEMIARKWHLPEELALPIVLHHAPPGTVRSYGARQQAGVWRIAAANKLAHALLVGSSGDDVISPTVELCRSIELDLETMSRIETETQRQTDEMKAVMFGGSDTPVRPKPAEHYQTLLQEPFCSIFVGNEPAFDACRILCSAIATKAKGQSPTIAVVSVCDDDNHASIAERLVAAEQSAGVCGLPLIVLSATGGVGGDLSALGDRATTILRMPFTVRAFIDSLNTLKADGA